MPEFNKVVEKYVEMRDRSQAIKKEADGKRAEIKEQMDKLEGWMLANMEGVNSIATDHGTAYTTDVVQARATDWEAFYEFVVDNNVPEMLQRRLSAKEIESYAEAHEGALPPGIDTRTEKVVRVRRS